MNLEGKQKVIARSVLNSMIWAGKFALKYRVNRAYLADFPNKTNGLATPTTHSYLVAALQPRASVNASRKPA